MTNIDHLLNRAMQFHQAGDLLQARTLYEQVINDSPADVRALNLLGATFIQRGEYQSGLPFIERALALKSDYLGAYNNLGIALKGLKRYQDAVACYRKALKISADNALVHYNLGVALTELRRGEEAVASFRRALDIKPDYAQAYNNLGMALFELGRHEEAVASLRRVPELEPDNYEAYNDLGIVLSEAQRHEEAVACFRKAVSIKPDFEKAHYNLGKALQNQGSVDAASECYRKALALRPNYELAYNNLLYLHAFCRNVSLESEYALAANWEVALLTDAERAAARARRFSFSNPPRSGRKLRVGVVSAELGQHPVAEFLEPILEKMDRKRLHLTLYSTAARSEPRAERIKGLADEYTSLVGVPDTAAAERIVSDRIDVLIDTTGHMKDCRLGIFARRAAPVQCHYIGYHGTTGLTEMDWFIADGTLLPPSFDAHFKEKIWRLPRLRLAYKGDISLPSSNWQPDSSGVVWLGSFNNMVKVREDALDLWARVMNDLPESRLLLKDSRATDPSVQQRVLTQLAVHGITRDRVEFVGHVPDRRSHMVMYDRVDIALDTIPLNSETTAFDALWMGVPLVALEGNWYGARMVSTILKSFGKPEWVAKDRDEFAAIVVRLARNVDERRRLREVQRDMMQASPLCDASGLAAVLEDALESMFDRWVEQRSRQLAGTAV